MDRCERYVRIGINQALKRPEIAELLKWFVLKLFRLAHLILNTPRYIPQTLLKTCLKTEQETLIIGHFLNFSGRNSLLNSKVLTSEVTVKENILET